MLRRQFDQRFVALTQNDRPGKIADIRYFVWLDCGSDWRYTELQEINLLCARL